MKYGCRGVRTGTVMKASEGGRDPSGAMKGGPFLD
jgi:hypothetical protein